MTKQEEKQKLRQTVRRLEAELPLSYQTNSSAAIAARLRSMPAYQAAETVFCFVGVGAEVDTRPLLKDALATGKRLCVPLCTGPGRMQLVPGAYGIPAPLESCPAVPVDGVDFAVIPCLTCSHSGRRLGRGGGYYDRFLSQYRGGAVLLCRERLIREEIPVESHDLPVPWVLTERSLYEDGVPARLG